MNDYENLKKKYGERFAKFCRSNFSTILEKEGVLSTFIEENFIPNKSLYDDLISQGMEHEFINYVFSYLSEFEIIKMKEKIIQTPTELMKKAGYTLYECKINSDVHKFLRYYKPDEALCTFRDPYRIKSHHIFFAVKDNVDEIKRENFINPQRQDEYGTSVISIQFNKSSGLLSIKNRYNHTVDNPDATFGNNLDKIIPGLTSSFEETYNINVVGNARDFELDGYEMTIDGAFCKYNNEIDNVYYCDNNRIIKGGEVYQFDKNRYLLIDNFLVDKKNKTLIDLSQYRIELKNLEGDNILTSDKFDLTEKEIKDFNDTFPNLYKNIEKIEITKQENDERLISIVSSGEKSYITIDKNNRIIKYQNDYIEEAKDNFLKNATYLQSFTAKKLKVVGNYFCDYAINLKHIDFPMLENIGTYFLSYSKITDICLPNVKHIGFGFNYNSAYLQTISAPLLESVDGSFLYDNKNLTSISLPSLKIIGSNFLRSNENIVDINFPNVEIVGEAFLYKAQHIQKISLPNVKNIATLFCYSLNPQEVNLPKVESIDHSFLRNATDLKKLSIPQCEVIYYCFMEKNIKLEELYAPKLKKVGKYFLAENIALREVNLPELERASYGFLEANKKIKMFIAPKLEDNLKGDTNRKVSKLIKRNIKLKKKIEELEK